MTRHDYTLAKRLHAFPRLWLAVNVTGEDASSWWFSSRREAKSWADAEARETGEKYVLRCYVPRTNAARNK